MKIQKSIMLQAGPSQGRTRSPEAFEEAVNKVKSTVGKGFQMVTTVLPSLVSGHPVGNLVSRMGSSAGNMDMSQLQKQQQDANMEYLKLQMEVQAENRQFTTLSNVLKSRHDTARAAINNLRA